MNTNTKTFNLHIGMPKTGTTTLQQDLFSNHSELLFLHHRHQQKNTRAEVCEFMNELILDNRKSPDISRCRQLHTQWVDQAEEENKQLLWSWESFMLHRHNTQKIRAENVRRLTDNVRLIVCLRHPVSLMQSVYLQILKRDNLRGLPKVGKKHKFESIEKWVTHGISRNCPPGSHLKYAETLQVFANVFGKDSIKIVLFEKLVENQDDYIRILCEIIGIDPEEGIRLSAGKRKNERWTQDQFDRLKSLNQSPLQALRFRFLNRKDREKWLGIDPNSAPRGAKATIDISPKLRSTIEEKTRAGNRMIQEQWGVPLEQYGYPV